ncbi:PSP1 domain-containing protein [Thiovibrio frasassiensis]|uniref:Regulatory iron-sulfur-containing complex subunit RicT n=1 Tax=Thiovibrio frasassiensis TaxID=2984131 RepID=A0A9X4RL55_9BACT|nr:regulatory iron-sulfur-containing complex subunit RicT [Thiovibrio frasassiensis]MDG4475716.1 regulatory iron-sulfur-containing complex subunit RicT [Thiovibrio frasassiensis]
MNETPETPPEELVHEDQHNAAETCYTVHFRPGDQFFSAVSRIQNLKVNELVMVQTEHGLEPATVHARTLPCPGRTEPERLGSHLIVRRGTRDETEKFARLLEREQEAFSVCTRFIGSHGLPMKLIKVERFLNGSKIIFYFTADTRVDFRELVKDLVQEFRTRVEIRQVGVRHETKMIGGLGCCGRELCCSSYLKNFAPVSIKMAKEQGLPLNPAKISGICNRLLCCLTYEYETYHAMRKKMPKPGKIITIGEKNYKVIKVNALEETLEVNWLEGQERNILLSKEEWSQAKAALPAPGQSQPRAQAPEADTQPRKKKPKQHKAPEGPDQ